MNTDERPWDEETNRPVWRQEINTDMKNEPVLSPNETGEFPLLSVFSDFSLCEGPGHVNEIPDKIS